MIGIGTFQIKGSICVPVIEEAVKAGYLLVDTARCYKNEREIGSAIAGLSLTRTDIYITSKIAPSEQGEQKAYTAVCEALRLLGLDYLDCMLIHWPGKMIPIALK